MKWVEIITLRCSSEINGQFIDELLKDVGASDSLIDTPRHLVEIKAYHNSVVETDFSIHIHWESEKEIQRKSPLGLRFSSALRNLGLLAHSVWVQTTAVEFPPQAGDTRSRDRVASVGSMARNGRRGG
jgi:hypothetical protein